MSSIKYLLDEHVNFEITSSPSDTSQAFSSSTPI
jgi:hypothetical protein